MADTIFNIGWYALIAWTCIVPNGYAPYLLLGYNAGDFVMTVLCGLGDGYLKEEGDLDLESYLMNTIVFALLGGFYAGKLSFKPGTDAYGYGIYLVFASFLIAFGYRYFQYGVIHVLRR
jgi:hypothetical protein